MRKQLENQRSVKVGLCTVIEKRQSDFVAKVAICTTIEERQSDFVVKVGLCTAIEGRLSDFVAKVAICTVIKDKTTGSKISCSRKTTNFTTFTRF